MIDGLILTLKVIIPPFLVLNFIPVMIWFERKGSAYIQNRRGPNRAHIFGVRLGGMIHNVADVVKLMTKEDIIPDNVNRFYFILAPLIAIFVGVVTIAVIPFADVIHIGERIIHLQVADLNVGILYIFAISSLGVYSVLLAGWASNNKYSLIGGLRAASQMVSYELALGLSVVALFMMAETVSVSEIVNQQGTHVLNWNFIKQPLAFIIFWVAIFAETNRTPFDLPEGESELVAGYHTEYSSMKFALFFMAEYAHMVVAAALIAALFVGGWQIPFISTMDLRNQAPFYMHLLVLTLSCGALFLGLLLTSKYRKGKYGDARENEVLIFGVPLIGLALLGGGAALFTGPWALPEWGRIAFAASMQAACFGAKMTFFAFFFIWVRWTVPRFRYDQVMNLGWKGMLPLALLNIVITGVVLLWRT
jgi:NADH-quinone oxidoreductase subunit H